MSELILHLRWIIVHYHKVLISTERYFLERKLPFFRSGSLTSDNASNSESSLSSLSEEKLKNSKVFCLMPWIHFHIWPNGKVFPCCLADPEISMGDIHQQPLKEIWNSAEYKRLRTNMLSGKESKECRRCYELESSADVYTLRKNSLASFGHLLSEVQKTKPDGTLPETKMAYMDIRFSNLCNFKCRTCGPIFSSSWQEEVSAHSPSDHQKVIPLSLLSQENFWQQLEPLLEHVEEVYFAGGESLISPEHYKILKAWIKQGRTDIRLRYTTNFSHFKSSIEGKLSTGFAVRSITDLGQASPSHTL